MPRSRRSRTDAQREKEREARRVRSLKRCRTSKTLAGCRRTVYDEQQGQAGRLEASDLAENRRGKIVSARKHHQATAMYEAPGSFLSRWNEAAKKAFYAQGDVYDRNGNAIPHDNGQTGTNSYEDFEEGNFEEEDFEEEDDGYVPFTTFPRPSPTRPRRSGRSNRGQRSKPRLIEQM